MPIYRPLNEITEFTFTEIVIRSLKADNPKGRFYAVFCLTVESDEVVLDSHQGILKKFKSLDPAVKAVESIFEKNIVFNKSIKLDLS